MSTNLLGVAAVGAPLRSGVVTPPPPTPTPTPTPATPVGNAAMVYPNLADAGTLTASSSAALMSPLRLQNPHVARKWRGLNPFSEWLVLDLGAARSLDTVAIIGINLTLAAFHRVRVSNTDSTGSAGELYDSGSLTAKVDPAYGYLVQLLPAPVAGRYVRVDLTDSLPYIEAGRFVVGLRRAFTVNFSAGWSRGYEDLSRRRTSRGGQTYIDRGDTYRKLELSFEFVSRAERNGLVEDLDLLAGMRDDVLVITDPLSSNLGRDTVWGLFDDIDPVVQPVIVDLFRKTFRVSERL